MNNTILVDKSNMPTQYGANVQQSMSAAAFAQPSAVLSLKENYVSSYGNVGGSSWDDAKKLPWKKESFVQLQRENFKQTLPWESKVFKQ